MKCYNIKSGIWIILFSFLVASNIYSQMGSWISQPVDQSMDGIWLYDAGETVIMVTREYSRYVYFFDINSSNWSIVDCKTTQNFKKYVVKGHVAMIYSDSILIGYSGLISKWDTIYYPGRVLDPNPFYGDRSFGSSDYLSYFVTDEYVYIFDSKLGEWKSYKYNLPFTYVSNNGRFWAKEDYVGIIMYDQSTNIYYNLAYSAYHQNFSELQNGGYYDNSTCEYNHGFIATWSDFNYKKFIGYSAFTNSFSVLTLPYLSYTVGCDSYLPKLVSLITTGLVQRIEKLESHRLYQLHLYGYDTRQGSWVYNTWTYNDSLWAVGFLTQSNQGGQFVTLQVVDNLTKDVYYWIFSGIDNSFHWVKTDIVETMVNSSVNGGKVITLHTESSGWIYSLPQKKSYKLVFSGKKFYSVITSDNFCITVLSDDLNPDSLYLFIFHEMQDNITNLTLPKFSGPPRQTHYIVSVPTSGLNKEVFCYSGITNSYQIIELSPAIILSNFVVKKIFAYMTAGSAFIFYNGNINEFYIIPNSLYYQAYSVGENIVLVKSAGNKFYSYSTYSNNLQEKSISENISNISAGNYIGLITTAPIVNKFYAYNGFYDNIIPVVPEASALNYKVGGLTAVIICSNALYAFDPQQPTSIEDKDLISFPSQFKLYQNYPNPFNPATKIKFELRSEILSDYNYVTIKIFDLLGREVRTLVNQFISSGTFEVEWDGRDDLGNKLASGVYVYKLSVTGKNGSETKVLQSRKMVLIR